MDHKWNTGMYDGDMAFVSRFGESLLELLQPQEGEVILDWGCGTGDLTAAIAQSKARVTGIDASPDMLAAAKAKYPELELVLADGQAYISPSPADAVFSNAALHWLTDAEGAAASIAGSLRPGGRLVAEFGAHGNIASIVQGLPAAFAAAGAAGRLKLPWYFPSVGEYASLLEKHGLEVELALCFHRPTPLEDGEAGLRKWVNTFADGVLSVLDETARRTVLEHLEQELAPQLFRDGRWVMDYRRLRVVARKRA
ncbi:MAG: Methyltransferase type 11 [Paenibacillaceae bacterium]|nr:Methyltransferase type 11 [Paenibacillaceae bacterium]